MVSPAADRREKGVAVITRPGYYARRQGDR